jgi:hypothetical protein
MYTHLENQRNNVLSLLCLLLVFIQTGCSYRHADEARKMADKLLKDIPLGRAYDQFPERHFASDQTHMLLDELTYKCDFANRKGNFVNEFRRKSPKGNTISFIYEYYLKCDSIRFILTYKLCKNPELLSFTLEPIEKENPMITNPDSRLQF